MNLCFLNLLNCFHHWLLQSLFFLPISNTIYFSWQRNIKTKISKQTQPSVENIPSLDSPIRQTWTYAKNLESLNSKNFKNRNTWKMFRNEACTSLQFNCPSRFKVTNHASMTNRNIAQANLTTFEVSSSNNQPPKSPSLTFNNYFTIHICEGFQNANCIKNLNIHESLVTNVIINSTF
jgi:hypothetical protein